MEKTLAVHPILTSNGPNLWSYACLNTHANSTTRLCLSLVTPRDSTKLEPRCRMPGKPMSSDPRQEFEAKWCWQREEPVSSIPPSWRGSHAVGHILKHMLWEATAEAAAKGWDEKVETCDWWPPLGRTSLARTINCRGRGSNSCWRVLFWSFITRTEQERWLGSHKHATGEIWVRVCTRNVLSHSRSKKQMIMSYFTHPRLCFRWLY